MPEGDSIHRAARILRPQLLGQTLVEVRLRDRGPVSALAGRAVTDVAALGKHLLVHVDGGWVVRSHLGMRGSWHSYAPDEAWRRPQSAAVLVLATAERIFIAFEAREAELLRASDLRIHPQLSALGPDLLGESPDLGAVVARARDQCVRDTEIGELLLDQRVAAGIGNVLKCETLFIERADPWSRLGALGDEALLALYATARRLMLQSMALGRRITVGRPAPGLPLRRGQPEHWVYGRRGRPCLVCGGRVDARAQGVHARTTYFCAVCQPAITHAP
ncbi:MAG: DNA-formamidopyrimidine glycosylase family protein [Myxococcota bacterium]